MFDINFIYLIRNNKHGFFFLSIHNQRTQKNDTLYYYLYGYMKNKKNVEEYQKQRMKKKTRF